MLGKLVRSLNKDKGKVEARNQDVDRRLDSLEKENDALWARMVALEVERNSHDGTFDCPGCKASEPKLDVNSDEDGLTINMTEQPYCAIHTFVTIDICGCRQ